jgi:hypothetical protein
MMLGDRPAPDTKRKLLPARWLAIPTKPKSRLSAFSRNTHWPHINDEVVLEGLQLATADANRGVLSLQQVERINLAVKDLVQDLADHDDV